MEPSKQQGARAERRRSTAAAKGGHGDHEQHRVSPSPSPRSPSTPEIQQAPSAVPHMQFPPQAPWNFYPPGGFLNLINPPCIPMSSQQLGENFPFAGLAQNLNVSPPQPPSANCTSKSSGRGKEAIDVDDGRAAIEETRTATKKRYWTHEEEVRLASAWLNSSNDPIQGNDKKGETFWKEIADYFNKHAPADRQRDVNQLKVHWTRLKTLITNFNGCWSAVKKKHTSGYSDDQLMDEAQKMYANVNNGKPFTLVHWWKTLKNEPKFCARISQLDKEKVQSDTIDLTEDRDQFHQQRPIGRDAAKAQRNGKRKVEEVLDGIVLLKENINKIVEVQQDRKQEREKVTETQLEISRLQLKAAQEQKEAKLLEAYTLLLQQDMSLLSDQGRINREKALQKMEQKLFGDNGED